MIASGLRWWTAGLLVLSSHAVAQAPAVALPSRLGGDTRAALERLIDSARLAGLPVSLLADRAAEGVLKGADDQRILVAVRALTRELGEARSILGGTPDATLISAVASALHAGAAPAELRRLARPADAAHDPHTLAVAFVTLVDLVAKNIPPAAATTAVGELLRRRATDDQFVALRSEVEQDIRGGARPEAALSRRVRSHAEVLDATPTTAVRPIKPPPPPG